MLRFIYKIDLRTELSSISPQLYHNLYYEAIKIDKDTDRYSKEDVEKALSDTLFNELEKYIVLYPYVYIKKQLVNFVDNKSKYLGEEIDIYSSNMHELAKYPIAYCIASAGLYNDKEVFDSIAKLTKIRLYNRYSVVRRKLFREHWFTLVVSSISLAVSFFTLFKGK